MSFDTLMGLSFLILLTLKLLEKIDLSWWCVTAPLWAPVIIGLVILALVKWLERRALIGLSPEQRKLALFVARLKSRS